MITVGELIRTKRQTLGMSAGALSLAAGLSRSYVAKVESGEIAPSVRCLGLIAEALELSPQEVDLAVRVATA